MADTYLGNPNLKAANQKIRFTKKQVREFLACQENPVYFIENYIKIVTLDHGLQQFKMYNFQDKLVSQQQLYLIYYIMLSLTQTQILPYLQTKLRLQETY